MGWSKAIRPEEKHESAWHTARQGGRKEEKTGRRLEGKKVHWGYEAWKEAGKLGEEEGGRQAGRQELSVRGEDDHIPRHSGAT